MSADIIPFPCNTLRASPQGAWRDKPAIVLVLPIVRVERDETPRTFNCRCLALEVDEDAVRAMIAEDKGRIDARDS